MNGNHLKVAVVGCGQIADGHVSEIQKLDSATVVAVCDRELLMAEQLAVRFGVGAHYDSFSRLLREQTPDVVHIATPPAAHLPLALEALAAGCHVFVEKPLALNYADSEALVEAVERAGKKLTIGHTYEHDPPAVEMRKLLESGVIGDVVHVESWFGYSLAGPFGKALMASPSHWVHQLPGKLFQNNINHLLNKVTEFVQDDRPEVHAVGWAHRPTGFGDARDSLLDELRVSIRGSRVSAYATFTANVKPVAHFQRLYGTENSVHLDFNSRTVTLEQGPKLPSAIGRLLTGFAQSWQYAHSAGRNVRRFAESDYHFFSGLNRLIGMYYDSIINDGPPPIAYRDILRVAWMMDEIFRQVGGGKR